MLFMSNSAETAAFYLRLDPLAFAADRIIQGIHHVFAIASVSLIGNNGNAKIISMSQWHRENKS